MRLDHHQLLLPIGKQFSHKTEEIGSYCYNVCTCAIARMYQRWVFRSSIQDYRKGVMICVKKWKCLWNLWQFGENPILTVLRNNLFSLCHMSSSQSSQHGPAWRANGLNPAVTYAAAEHQGPLFWISCKRLKLLRKAGSLQLIQNSAPSVAGWR